MRPELKQEIESKRAEIASLQKELDKLESQCSHSYRPLTAKDKADKWFSDGAVCLVCKKNFGWRCKKSPDETCHYFSEVRDDDKHEIELNDGTIHVLPDDYDGEYENTDSCIFCGHPEERK
jgi:uncharacterized cupin superfamily protein